MRPPDFFIVGAAKAGTTSLFHYLAQHPGLFLPTVDKEPGYFCDTWGAEDSDYYHGLFADAAPDQLTGEASTPYLSCPASPGLIHAANPDAKIVILLRNPAQRAFSLYLQMVKMGHENLAPFERALAAEAKRSQRDPSDRRIPGYHYNYLYFESGRYEDQLRRYFDTFPREQVKIFLFDDLVGDTKATVSQALEFLGVEPEFDFEAEVFNPARYPRSVRLQHFFKRSIEDRARRLGIFRGILLAHWLKNLNLGNIQPPKVTPETYNALVDRYAESVAATSELIGRDLSAWMEKR